ncbi:hypothetical protein DSO57_1007904 [Entomophthora muscae]|uniref:Uncharacterized protein n=1 Tax=Entomophthora muscae TaxID=34485 RepID=A0ACC2T765_9FUNG|nr:hypothetical protein DSO57_1007904 [Entomophthora muscae]
MLQYKSPALWDFLSSSDILMGKDTSQLLYLLNNLPGLAHGTMTAGEFPVKSLIFNNDDLLPVVAPKFSPLVWSHWHPCLPPSDDTSSPKFFLEEREFLQDCCVFGPGQGLVFWDK